MESIWSVMPGRWLIQELCVAVDFVVEIAFVTRSRGMNVCVRYHSCLSVADPRTTIVLDDLASAGAYEELRTSGTWKSNRNGGMGALN